MESERFCTKVLVIDDDPIFREVVSAAVRTTTRAEVLTARDGQEALALLRSNETRLSLIMLDLNMPDFDGIEFIQAMVECRCRVPFIIASGASSITRRGAELLSKANSLNLLGILSKPINFADLASILKAIEVSSRQPEVA